MFQRSIGSAIWCMVCVCVCVHVCVHRHTGQHALKQQTIFVSSDPSALTAIKSLQKLKAMWTAGLIWLKVKAFVQSFEGFAKMFQSFPHCTEQHLPQLLEYHRGQFLYIKPNGLSVHMLYIFGLFVCFFQLPRIVKIHKMVLVLVFIYLESQSHLGECSGHDI